MTKRLSMDIRDRAMARLEPLRPLHHTGGEQADWLRARMAGEAFALRGLVAERTERGLKVDYRTVWAFAHGERLSFKKNSARQ